MNYPVIDVLGTGTNLRTMIDDRHMTVAAVARYLGATTSLVYRYIRGEVLPSTDRLLALSSLLGVTVNDIVVTR
jgi:transcriptional regulator with XRE-family HTH domain